MNDTLHSALEILRPQIPEAEGGGLDALLRVYLDTARDFILARTGRAELPEGLLSVQAAVALVFYNRQGMEGERAHAEGEVRRETVGGEGDLPQWIEQALREWRVLRMARRGRNLPPMDRSKEGGGENAVL